MRREGVRRERRAEGKARGGKGARSERRAEGMARGGKDARRERRLDKQAPLVKAPLANTRDMQEHWGVFYECALPSLWRV